MKRFLTLYKCKYPQVILSVLILSILWAGITAAVHKTLLNNTIGADYYINWLPAKSLVADHLDPYDKEIVRQTQLAIYGRPAKLSEDQLAFSYPFHLLFLIIPFTLVPFDWAQAAWLSLNLMLIIGSMALLLPKNRKYFSPTLIFFFPVFYCLILGNFQIIMGTLILTFFGFFAVKEKKSIPLEILFGWLLAWATAKPQFIWAFIIFIIIFSIRKKMWPFLSAFFITLLLFIILSLVISPHWITTWLRQIQAYSSYVHSNITMSIYLSLFLPGRITIALTILSFLFLSALTVRVMFFWWESGMGLLELIALLGLITFLFHPNGTTGEQIIYLVPLIFWIISEIEPKATPVHFFWFTSLVLSWAPFLFERQYERFSLQALAWERCTIFFYIIWVIWIFSRKSASNYFKVIN